MMFSCFARSEMVGCHLCFHFLNLRLQLITEPTAAPEARLKVAAVRKRNRRHGEHTRENMFDVSKQSYDLCWSQLLSSQQV